MTKKRIASLDEIAVGELCRVEVDGVAVCLARVAENELYAIGDVCTHEEQSLSEGELDGYSVECPLHGSAFDLRSGSVSMPPAYDPAPTFPVTLDGSAVFIEI
ncbi:MAG: non-heme iron oxygenase ferredoxin subunit [Actinomycetota bacterium]|nr:non-heme iron oxygenase ferredoxin subunit [Actinomycetota bacterium]